MNEWSKKELHLEEIQHGISRHPVVFVNYDGILYVIKELPAGLPENEYELLISNAGIRSSMCKTNRLCIVDKKHQEMSAFYSLDILKHLFHYRSLFIGNAVDRYQIHLLDAISGLLVQLHSNGFYWGDCSLSNILFRRDAGALQAYLVDAETAEFHLPRLSPMLRYHDLEIMQENILGELTELQTMKTFHLAIPFRNWSIYSTAISRIMGRNYS